MASNVPTRRVPHARIPVHKDENATSRTRAFRAKPPSMNGAGASSAAVPPSRVAATTAAARAKAAALAKDTVAADQDPQAGKRKRSAFGEVVVNKPKLGAKGSLLGTGKDKISEAAPAARKFDGVVLKSKTAATTTSSKTTTTAVSRASARTTAAPAPAVRRPIRPVASHTDVAKAPAPVDDAMAIDPPALKAPPRRLAASPRKASLNHHASKHEHPPAELDDEEALRVLKKRRTSSEAPEDHVEAEHVEEMEQAQGELARHIADIQAEPEADPNGDSWIDLDKDDVDDPLMVSEYVIDIFEYLKEVEQTTLPNPNYMENQKDLAWKMRGILTDWLIQVHMRFRLLPETLFLAINIIDRFLSARVVSLAKLQLVGITCMFVASKVEEIVSPSASDFLRCADSSYSQVDILQAERYILKTLEWNMSYPNPIHFLRRISKADEYNVQVRTIAKYLMEIECVEWRLIAAPPSLLAAASIWLSRLMLGREEWTPNLAHYSSYNESALIPTANLMLNYILKPIRHPSFYKKYASKKFMKASIFARKWALNRWTENSQVQLDDELPSLKALIRTTRDRAIEDGIDPDAGGCEELNEALAGR